MSLYPEIYSGYENFLEIASFFNVLNSPRKSAFIGSG